MKEELEKVIKACAEKAAKTHDCDEALKFTQAILNTAHALTTLVNMCK